MSQVQAIDGSQFQSTVISSQSIKNQDSVSFQAVFNKAQKAADSSISTTDLNSIFQKAADTYGVDIDLLKAVAKAESNYNANATSSAGAMGIMQLMPATAKSLGVRNAYDPEQNVMGGARLLASHIQKYNGDIALALAAYNAGSNAVDSYGGIPPYAETQNYVNKVLAYYNKDITIPDQTVSAANVHNSKPSSVIGGGTTVMTKEERAIAKELEGLTSNDIYLTSNTEDTVTKSSETDSTSTSASDTVSASDSTNRSSANSVTDNTTSSSYTYDDYLDYVDDYLNIISGNSGSNADNSTDLFSSSLLGTSNSSYTSALSNSILTLLKNTLASTES